MKFFAKILLAIFILFQFSTIIMYVINERNKTNISITVTEEEEESVKEVKMVKEVFQIVMEKTVIMDLESSTPLALDTYLLKKYFATATIFLLPPEQV